jgi:hypothetical protein
MEWLLHLLVFVFGYYTCKTFYVFRSGALTVGMFKMTQLTTLMILTRSIEQYAYVKSFGESQMKQKGATEKEISNYHIYVNNDIEFFKNKSIKVIVSATPNYFKHLVEFDDWESAMRYLNDNKTIVNQFLK